MRRRRFFEKVADVIRLPRPPAPEIPAGSFVLCPLFWPKGVPLEVLLWQQLVYRRALEEALAVARPSLPERDLAGGWN